MTDRVWESDYVDLTSEPLSEAAASRVYEQFPGTPRSVERGCPTCDGEGSFPCALCRKEHACDCEQQLQLHKHYLAANVGVVYQRMAWEDYEGDPKAGKYAYEWLSAHRDMMRSGIGLFFHSQTFGAGKTMLLNLVAKSLVRLGYEVYATTFQGMVQMFTAGWRDDSDRAAFERLIVTSRVLVLDDVGKEFKTQSVNLPESLFDHVLRQRVTAARPTLITANLDAKEIEEGYGGAILSLMKERSIWHEVQGSDFRPQAQKRSMSEAVGGWRRPII